MQGSLKKKAQSLPRLRRLQFQQKKDNLAKLFAKDSSPLINPQLSKHHLDQVTNNIDPELTHKQKINQILLKSKSMIQKNKDKIEIAKRFRILKKKSAGPFLTGVDIYKEQQQQQKPLNDSSEQKQQNDEEELRKILTEKYDDLAQLRKMIRKTSKNLGAYKQQTLSIQKNLINMADRYGEVAVDILSRKKLNSNIYDYKEEI